jgi:type IV secretory pathway VirB2 component (pilin)
MNDKVEVPKEIVVAAMQFLVRVELKGAEAQTYLQVIQQLQAALTGPVSTVVEVDSPTADS